MAAPNALASSSSSTGCNGRTRPKGTARTRGSTTASFAGAKWAATHRRTLRQMCPHLLLGHLHRSAPLSPCSSRRTPPCSSSIFSRVSCPPSQEALRLWPMRTPSGCRCHARRPDPLHRAESIGFGATIPELKPSSAPIHKMTFDAARVPGFSIIPRRSCHHRHRLRGACLRSPDRSRAPLPRMFREGTRRVRSRHSCQYITAYCGPVRRQ